MTAPTDPATPASSAVPAGQAAPDQAASSGSDAAGPAETGTGTASAADALTKKAGRNLYAAIPVALGLIAVFIVSLVWLPGLIVALVAVLVGRGLWELRRAFRTQAQIRIAFTPLVVGVAATYLVAYLAALPATAPDSAETDRAWWWRAWDLVHQALPAPATAVVVGLALTGVVCLLWRLRRGADGYIRDVSASLFALVYVGLTASVLVLLLIRADGPALMAFFLLAIIGSDTGGYVAGLIFGKHKMAPSISPKKSWEGFIGSLLLAPVGGLIVVAVALDVVWWRAVIVAELIALAGICGDLVESVVKRDLGVKDLGGVIPGHGGVMDRIDSYLVAAPVAWVAISLVMPYV
ncbi:MAG: phosphatidate cytidylyltransferase [Propionibacteriaceae bacterium]|jgi:phosphatidate cytidylyltransferase|nr:phosphatidate cytidylyltransferase [Propionibacteriaceae bacterium]